MASRSEIKIVNGQKRRKPNSSSSGSGSPSPPPFDLELAHAAQQVQRHLQQHPDGLVQRRLLNLHPLPGHRNTADATHWRCNACGEAVDATSAHLAWHACRTVGRWKQHHKGWSLHTMQAEGLVVMAATGPLPTATQPPHAATTRSAHQPPQPQQQRPQQHPTCLLCKQALQPLRRHRCASPVLRGYLVDWSAAAGGDALRAGRLTGDHQAAANLARRHPGHVVVMSPPPGAAGGREHLCRCHLLLAPSALGPAAGLGAFAVHLMGRAQADCAATADAVEAAARAAAAAAAGEAVVPLAWNRLGFYVGMVSAWRRGQGGVAGREMVAIQACKTCVMWVVPAGGGPSPRGRRRPGRRRGALRQLQGASRTARRQPLTETLPLCGPHLAERRNDTTARHVHVPCAPAGDARPVSGGVGALLPQPGARAARQRGADAAEAEGHLDAGASAIPPPQRAFGAERRNALPAAAACSSRGTGDASCAGAGG